MQRGAPRSRLRTPEFPAGDAALNAGLAAVAGFLTSTVLSGMLSRYRGRWALLDRPNARSLHERATPRSGGLAILAGLCAGALVLFAGSEPPMRFLAALVLVAAVSFADDVRPLPPWARLSVHIVAAVLLVFAAGMQPVALHVLPGIVLSATWLVPAVCLLLTVWWVNLYNFMDGMDGFAAGMAVIGFGSFALLGALAAAPAFAAASLLVAAAVAGFLPFNFPPARIFMGDVGSGTLGLLVAVFLLWAERGGLFPLWIGLMVFSPFAVDATWTVLRRAGQGQRPWVAHREHFYQRLVRLGWSHRRTVLWAYILMLKCSLLAVVGFCFTAVQIQGLLLGWTAAVYLALIAYINVLEHARTPQK